MPKPEIVNVEQPFREMPHLDGIHILDAEPFGQALVGLGVPEEDLPNWTIYTGRPDENFDYSDPRQVVVRPSSISLEMDQTSAGSADEQRHRYVGSFKSAASKVIVKALAEGAVNSKEGKDRPLPLRVPERGRGFAAFFIGSLVGSYGVKYGLHGSDWNAFEGQVAGMVGLPILVHNVCSPFRYARKAAKQFLRSNPNTVKALEDAVLPEYDKR